MPDTRRPSTAGRNAAALIPPPRRHRHHYYGVFAPHAKLRARITAGAGPPVAETAPVTVPARDPTLPAAMRRRASVHWARQLARIDETRPLSCPRCQGDMRLIAFLTEPATVRAILAHLSEPSTPPLLAPRARAPPELETEPARTPGFAFDQFPPWDPTGRGNELPAPIRPGPASQPLARPSTHRLRTFPSRASPPKGSRRLRRTPEKALVE